MKACEAEAIPRTRLAFEESLVKIKGTISKQTPELQDAIP